MDRRRDGAAVRQLLGGLRWLGRSIGVLLLLAVLWLLLLPAQLVSWLAGGHSFWRTEPYLWLRWVFHRYTAFPGELPITGMHYAQWKGRQRR